MGGSSVKIKKLVCASGRTGFYFDDQKAIKNGAKADGFAYQGTPTLTEFTQIRQAGEAISVMLILENDQIAHGDCAAVQYSGVGGRDPLFLAAKFIPLINEVIKPRLEGRELSNFRELALEIDTLVDPLTGKRLHTAIRYGVTQAILDAVAQTKGMLMAEVIATEYQTTLCRQMIPIFTQSGDERYLNVDKMIIKGAEVLPHGLFNSVEKLGKQGELLLEYLEWLKQRVLRLRATPDYQPVFHVDVYGMIGLIFANNLERIVEYLARLAEAVAPFRLRIEGPVDLGEQLAQVEYLAELTTVLDARKISVEIVADEWCNTLEDVELFAVRRAGHMIQIKTPDLGGINNSIQAVLACQAQQVGAYLGGTCNETDRSTQVCVHAAIATSPDQILAKPGMGMDEGYMIVYNEMQRVLALLEAKR